MNVKQTIELMTKAGWTGEALALSLGIETKLATEFLATGRGFDNEMADKFEAWALRRQGTNGVGTPTFQKPTERLILNTAAVPPIILPADVEVSQDGPDMAFSDITNERARKKMLADGLKGAV